MDAHDRYALAIALLEGDREARKVLADLLEEQGDRGLAQWARGGGNAKHRRLDFALMLLPCGDAIRLSMEFMRHACGDRENARLLRSSEWIIDQWETGQRTAGELMSWCESVLAGLHPVNPAFCRNVARNHLLEAIRCSVRAAECEAGGANSGTPRHWQTTTGHHLRVVAAACQKQAQPKRPPALPTPAPTEIDWQIERTRELFQRLLNSGS
jgi:hypothetical protein